jgi:formyl-CoA transferase
MGSVGALTGIRVVELANYVSGPYASMLLADFGAEVIKVELPGHGDPFRGWGATDYNPTFGAINRNKKSITLDLKTPEGRKSVLRLVKSADIVIENFRSGTLDRLGLGYEALRAENPRLIYCSITGFGNHGAYANRPGYDTLGQAMGGLLSLLTDVKNPSPMGVGLSDHLAGIVACNGILAALQARHTTGKGQRVDTSLIESTVSFISEAAARMFAGGGVPYRATRTHHAQVFAFVDCDGLPFVIHLSSPQKFWEGLLRAIERPQWAADPRFKNRKGRSQNYDALNAELKTIFRTKRRDHWLKRLDEEDVPSGPLYDLKEVFDDPQYKELELVVRVPHPRRGHEDHVRNGARLSETPTTVHSCAPDLGQHNAELIGDLSGR